MQLHPKIRLCQQGAPLGGHQITTVCTGQLYSKTPGDNASQSGIYTRTSGVLCPMSGTRRPLCTRPAGCHAAASPGRPCSDNGAARSVPSQSLVLAHSIPTGRECQRGTMLSGSQQAVHAGHRTLCRCLWKFRILSKIQKVPFFQWGNYNKKLNFVE